MQKGYAWYKTKRRQVHVKFFYFEILGSCKKYSFNPIKIHRWPHISKISIQKNITFSHLLFVYSLTYHLRNRCTGVKSFRLIPTLSLPIPFVLHLLCQTLQLN